MRRARILTCWLVCAMALPLLGSGPVAAAPVPPAPGAAPAAVVPTISTFATGVNPIGGLVLAPDGSLFAGDTAANVVRRIDSLGAVTVVAGTGEPDDHSADYDGWDALSAPLSPRAVAVDGQGVLYIANSAVVYAMTPDGVLHLIDYWPPLEIVPGIGFPMVTDLDVSGDTVRVSKRIDWWCGGWGLPCPVTPVASIEAFPRYGLPGATVVELTDPAIFRPSGLAHGPHGARYVADRTVKRWDVSPVISHDLGPFSPPQSLSEPEIGVATDPSGRVVLAIADRQVVCGSRRIRRWR